MLLINAVKILAFAGSMIPIAAAALGVGILFAGYNLAVARNPEESEALFNGTLIGFAFIETFVFMAIGVGFLAYIL